jgi:hypothetical protein
VAAEEHEAVALRHEDRDRARWKSAATSSLTTRAMLSGSVSRFTAAVSAAMPARARAACRSLWNVRA